MSSRTSVSGEGDAANKAEEKLAQFARTGGVQAFGESLGVVDDSILLLDRARRQDASIEKPTAVEEDGCPASR